jgi:hypothetical protein
MTLTGVPAMLDRWAVEAVEAAVAADEPRLALAVARADSVDGGHLRRLLVAVLRPVLEDLHPDGVDGDDLADLLDETVRETAWTPGVDPLALAVVLTGAFGVTVAQREELPHPVSDVELVRHAVLLLGRLLCSRPGLRLRPLLDRAWTEIARADAQD